MSYLEAIIFGIIQGITEFLPVSSTAHIVIAELLLGHDFPGLGFEIYLHLASVLAVMIYFYHDILDIIKGFLAYLGQNKTQKNKIQFYFALYLITATFITGILGLLLEDLVSDIMKTYTFMGLALIITGIFLILIERFQEYGNRAEKDMTIKDAVIVGLGQTLAVLPGISRSGTTLIAGLWAGLKRETAVRYSFLLLIPVVLGSSVLSLQEFTSGFLGELGTGPLILSFLTSFVFSVLGIIWLIDIIKKKRLLYLSIYCFLIGSILIIFM